MASYDRTECMRQMVPLTSVITMKMGRFLFNGAGIFDMTAPRNERIPCARAVSICRLEASVDLLVDLESHRFTNTFSSGSTK